MSTLEVFVPVAHSRVENLPLAPRLEGLSGKRVAWLDNLKANAGAFLRETESVLQGAHTGFDSILESKNATAAAADEVMSHLRTCDAVVLAIAD
jgi:hypothetical protein